ncbi:MAG: DUF3106 domain-containing protein [Acidobacteriaceae bacterium]
MRRFRKARGFGTAPRVAVCSRSLARFFQTARKKFLLGAAGFTLLMGCGIASGQPFPRRGGYGRIAFIGQHEGRGQQRTQHLPQWFQQHQNLPPQAQQRALRNEPGFRRLPPAEQQRLSNRLRQLDAMPPAQRQRVLQHVEAWERLSPTQRRQVRTAVQQVSRLPYPRQEALHQEFRDLCRMPPEQRQSVFNSPQFRNQFSDNERHMLKTLMSIQPYTPPRRPGGAMGYDGRP